MQNPYPKDVFRWDNEEELNFNRGRFNQHCFEIWENCINDVLKLIDEDEWKCGRNMEECAYLLKKRLREDTSPEQNAPQGHYENTGQVGENGNPIRRWIQDKQGIPSDEQEIKKELDKDYALDKQGEQDDAK